MAKRSNFERKPQDFYITPIKAVRPLVPHLPKHFKYIDPCYGTGAIAEHLTKIMGYDLCRGRYDLFTSVFESFHSGNMDARTHKYDFRPEYFITNPPWDRSKKSDHLLHKIIDNLAGQKPTWLLLDSDWAFTEQSGPYMKYCVKIVAMGRVKWFPDTNSTGKDNCAWYLFDKNHRGPTEFVGR